MRTIAITDQSSTVGWFRDVEETIEEAITWAEEMGLHVTGNDGESVHVSESIDDCDGCGNTTFIVRKEMDATDDPDLGFYLQFCMFCMAPIPEWAGNLHTEHYEQMMKEINR